MQNVPKKAHRTGHISRWVLLVLCMVLLAGALWLWQEAKKPAQEVEIHEAQDDTVLLWSVETDQIASVSFVLRDDEGFTAVQQDGTLCLTDGTERTIDASDTSIVLEALKSVKAEVLADEWEENAEDMTAFGLDNPENIVTLTLTDGTVYTLSIGNAPSYDKTWQYARLAGDARLLAVSRGTAEELYQTKTSLWPVEQPTIHAQRLSSITLRDATGNITMQWQLRGNITDSDAQDKWWLTVPLTYPADADTLSNLRTAAENLRLGEYLGEATTENCVLYGMDVPRLQIELHMDAGTMGTVGTTGSYSTTDWPESDVTFIIGGQESDLVDYVCYDGAIYRCSALLHRAFFSVSSMDTLTRYPVLTALDNLASLQVKTGDTETNYIITRVEQITENNDLAEDDEGETLYDITLTKNGVEDDYSAFAAAYEQLMMVTVSGRLEQGWTAQETPHTEYRFEDIDGTVHTVALTPYDAMHDAVIVDGTAVFYLIQGGFKLVSMNEQI